MRIEEDVDPGMQRSHDCPECNKVAFFVVKPPDILRCLHCGCEWEFTLPPPAPIRTPREQLEAAGDEAGQGEGGAGVRS